MHTIKHDHHVEDMPQIGFERQGDRADHQKHQRQSDHRLVGDPHFAHVGEGGVKAQVAARTDKNQSAA